MTAEKTLDAARAGRVCMHYCRKPCEGPIGFRRELRPFPSRNSLLNLIDIPARATLAALERVIWRQLRVNNKRNCSSLPQPRFLGAATATSLLPAALVLARPARRFWMDARREGSFALFVRVCVWGWGL